MDAGILLEHFLGIKPYAVNAEYDVSSRNLEELWSAVRRRCEGYPLQYIVGEWEFYGLPFYVGEGVLIPRADTETLVEVVLKKAQGISSLADLCSGSGCIAVTLEKLLSTKQIFAVEKSADALSYLHRNVQRHASSVKVVQGDVLNAQAMEDIGGLDAVVCNPPYLTDRDMTRLQR